MAFSGNTTVTVPTPLTTTNEQLNPTIKHSQPCKCREDQALRRGELENKVRVLKQVCVNAFYSILSLVLTREAAENIGKPDKVASQKPTSTHE